MASWEQHKLLNGVIIPQFLDAMGVEATKEAVHETKEIFKRYLRVHSTASLSDRDMSHFINAFCMLAAREWGIELTEEFAEKTMTQILKETNYGYY
jgi:hypothetical protein